MTDDHLPSSRRRRAALARALALALGAALVAYLICSWLAGEAAVEDGTALRWGAWTGLSTLSFLGLAHLGGGGAAPPARPPARPGQEFRP